MMLAITGSTAPGWSARKSPNSSQPLGDPGPGVQQLAGLQERRQRRRDHRGTVSATRLAGRQRWAAAIAWSPKNSSSAKSGSPTRTASRSVSVRPRGRLHGSRSSGRRDDVEHVARSATGVPAIRLMQSSERQAGTRPTVLIRPRDGLKPSDAVEGRRHPSRTGRVGRHGERHLAQRHRQRRTGARAAGDQVLAEDAARDRVRGTGAVQAGGELVQVVLADQDGARRREVAGQPARSARPRRRTPGRPAWSASRRRRCCP